MPPPSERQPFLIPGSLWVVFRMRGGKPDYLVANTAAGKMLPLFTDADLAEQQARGAGPEWCMEKLTDIGVGKVLHECHHLYGVSHVALDPGPQLAHATLPLLDFRDAYLRRSGPAAGTLDDLG